MKKIISFSLVLMMVLSLFAFAPLTASAAVFAEGGTEENPTIINTQEEFNTLIGQTITGHYKIADTLKEVTVNDYINVKNGSLDGNNATFTFADNKGTTAGLFYQLEGTVNLKNIILSEVDVNTTSANYGALAGKTVAGAIITVDNVHNYINITASNKQVAGFIGTAQYGSKLTFTNSTNNGNITSTNTSGFIGGFVGRGGFEIELINCKNTGDIKGAGSYVAGMIGGNLNAKSTLSNCANEGSIESTDYVAGLVLGSSDIIVSNSYNAGMVNATAGKNGGQAIAYSTVNKGVVTNCFNFGECYMVQNGMTRGGVFAQGCKVENSYNANGKLRNFAAAADTLDLIKCYSVELSDSNPKHTVKTQDELKTLVEDGLLTDFVTATPTKESAYPFPQLDGNEYVAAAAEIPETLGTIGDGFSTNEDISGTYAGNKEVKYEGKYVAGYSVASDLFGWEKSYGMILTDANGTEYKADAVTNSATTTEGKYGVLFYGSKLVPGSYTLKPYVTYTNYGETNTVYADEISVIVE